jgi:hypothetical protein
MLMALGRFEIRVNQTRDVEPSDAFDSVPWSRRTQRPPTFVICLENSAL